MKNRSFNYLLLLIALLLSPLLPAHAQNLDWSSQGYYNGQALPSSSTFTYNGAQVTLSWRVNDNNGSMSPMPGSPFVCYEAGSVGGYSGSIQLGFDNDENNPNDYIELTFTFSQPQYGLSFSVMDIDRYLQYNADFQDTIEVAFTTPDGTEYNVRQNDAWWNIPNSSTVQTYHSDAFTGTSGSDDDESRGNVNINLSGVAASSLRLRFYCAAEAGSNPTQEKINMSDLFTVRPNLSASTKTVTDLNGGEVMPGDTLEYTIRIAETAGNGAYASVLDALPAGLENMQIRSAPSAAIDQSSGTTLDLQGFFVPGDGSETIIIRADISDTTALGSLLVNTATITEFFGSTHYPSASIRIGSDPNPPTPGNKHLYLHTGPSLILSRERPASSGSETISNGSTFYALFTLNPTIAKETTLRRGTAQVSLLLDRRDREAAGRDVQLLLMHNESLIGHSANRNITGLKNGTPRREEFSLDIYNDVALATGDELMLVILNLTSSWNNRRIRVYQQYNGEYSYILPQFNPVIVTESIAVYSSSYPNSTPLTEVQPGQTVYIRTTISDPFGAFDINHALLNIDNNAGTALLSDQTMSSASSTSATKTYEYPWTVPLNAGTSLALTVTAHEGVENLISHSRTITIPVNTPEPNLDITKISYVRRDPINNTSNPKRIPGAELEYIITINNTGNGSGDEDSILVSDMIPPNTVMLVNSPYASGPVQFNHNTSGLTYTFTSLSSETDDLTFLNSAGTAITPSPNSDGADVNVAELLINPKGTLNTNSTFSIQFRVLLQ